ncbi:hypothetical protein [Streptomyces sirii]|uniref:hypothetical protein n=1 Tax=Streptomyces sirii TaxID=3127701 RepID=UPI003D36DFB0
MDELTAPITAKGSRRLRLSPEEVVERQLQRWEDMPDEAWFSKWAPLPAGVHRGPYARPTRAILQEVETLLKERLADEQQRDDDRADAPYPGT